MTPAFARRSVKWRVTPRRGSSSVRSEATILVRARILRSFNSAALVSPAGDWTARYDKMHLVPFGEYLPFPSLFSFAGGLTKEVGQFEHGTSRRPLDAAGEPLGIFICYESIFPDEVRQFAAQGAQVFVNISNDGWYGDSGAYAQHLNQTRMRAIENNRWLLSATDTGVTASIDPWGRMAARVPRKETNHFARALRSHFRNHVLHAPRRLVCLCLCDNFYSRADRALFIPQEIGNVLMNQELVLEYEKLGKKVHELREYL